jgi:phthalate 4,5-dioxygenase oxygenase subunit
MLSHEENELLCRVEGDAPMGQLIRRYWIPACLSAELPEPNGIPKRVQLVGLRLVVWRDQNGEVGVMQEECPHRGASLALARGDGDGLVCIYHGWKIGIDGTVLETPCEPARSRVRYATKHVSYPTREAGGVVWVYLGPAKHEPRLPEYPWMRLPGDRVRVTRSVCRANFMQSIEGGIDSAHSDFLHSTQTSTTTTAERDTVGADGTRVRPSNDKAPTIEVQNTTFGFYYAGIRTAARDPENLRYVRITAFVAPFHCFIPPNYVQMCVPTNDYETAFYLLWYNADRSLTDDEIRSQEAFLGLRPGVDLDENGVRFGKSANGWLQDRGAMARGDSYTGVVGTTAQDCAVQESMGAIQDRTKEHLGASDIAVIRMRRLMLAAARAVQAGEDCGFNGAAVSEQDIECAAGILGRDEDWRSMLTSMLGKTTAR